MQAEENPLGLEPELTYNDEGEFARIRAQGVNCEISWPMFELALEHGGLEVSKAVPYRDLEAVYPAVLGQPCRVTINVEPIEEADP